MIVFARLRCSSVEEASDGTILQQLFCRNCLDQCSFAHCRGETDDGSIVRRLAIFRT